PPVGAFPGGRLGAGGVIGPRRTGKPGLSGPARSDPPEASLEGLSISRALQQAMEGRNSTMSTQEGARCSQHESTTVGFYPEITDGCKRVENFWSCLATLRRILGLWNRSMYSNTSALTASSVG